MKDLAPLLNPVIVRELASIGAIDTATQRERRPDYVVLFHSAKTSKQANIEQMNAMIRGSGEKPAERARFRELLLQAQTAILERVGTTPTMRAMRIVERDIIGQYEDVYDQVDGIMQRGLLKCWHRAIKNWTVLTAHIAKRGRFEVEENVSLPMPLDQYFANKKAHACMRCLFDRPGRRPALERSDPNPYTYICSACHDEVIADFPTDLQPRTPRETEIIEKALGRPSKLKAESLVLAKMSGLAGDAPPLPTPYKTAFASEFDTARFPPSSPPQLEVVNDATTEEEQRYTSLLFDFESVRRNW